MKYYSRSPKELEDYIEEKKQKGKDTIRAGRRLLVGNIILVAFFFIVLFLILVLVKIDKKGSAHEFNLRGWDVELGCKEKQCQATFKQNRVTSAAPDYIIWQHEQEQKQLAAVKVQADAKETWSSSFSAKNALGSKDKVFIKIFFKEEEFSFRVFP